MYLAPLNYDRFFKKIFKDTEIAKAFLEDFLDVKIETIERLDDKHRITDKAKIVEFDYRCKIAGKYIIIDMQQWYKPDVSQRFYIYHTLNSSLQLEDLKTKLLPSDLLKSGDETSKEIKDYRLIEPVLTLIWMVHDSLEFKNDYIAYKLLPENIAKFLEDDTIWYKDNYDEIVAKRDVAIKIMNNDEKEIDFLKKNKLIFMFQKNIVKNMEAGKQEKYRRWFNFASKTFNKKNEKKDFAEFKKDPLFETIIKRLDKSELTESDMQYISTQDELIEKLERYNQGMREEGKKLGIRKGKEIGIKKGEEIGIKKEQIKIVKKLWENQLSIDIIIDVTGLTKIEIEKIINEIKLSN